jgi:hypothetical protein
MTEAIETPKEVVITDDQKKKLVEFWNSQPDRPPGLSDMVAHLFPGKDGRSLEGMAIKKVLAELKINAKPVPSKSAPRKTDMVVLTEQQKEFLDNNKDQPALDLARTIFANPSLAPASAELRAVARYLVSSGVTKAEVLEPYAAPRNFVETLARINKYIVHKLERENLTPGQKKDIESTQSLLLDARFNLIINSYLNLQERELYEGEFIKSIYDKVSDCSNEEISQFMNLAGSVVTELQYVAELNGYKDKAKFHMDNSDGVPKNISDRISSLEKNIIDIKGYQDKLIKSLQGERSKRLENRIAENQSVAAIIAGWKLKQHRDRMIRYAQVKDAAIREELKRLDTMDNIKAELFGISADEIVPKES